MNPFFKTCKNIMREWDNVDIFLAILLTVIFFPLSIIFWVVRIMQEWED